MSKLSYSAYLEKVLAATGGNVYWLDQHCVYQGCNENVAKTLRLKSSKDIIGLTDEDLLRFGNWNSEQAHAFIADDREVIRTKQAKRNIEEPVIFDEAGNEVYFLTTRIPIFDEDGQVLGVVGTSTDITALKKAEQALFIAKQQAEAANQVKTEFLASMSHDVKTPLSGVISIAELLSHRLQGGDREMMEDLARCGKKLMVFFENCIELSKMDMAQLQDLDQVFSLRKIIEAIHELFSPSATAKHLRFTIHQDPLLPEILRGNQVNIYRVILNLIGNAIKFTSQGSVSLTTQLVQKIDDENIIVKIIVQDTGIGIAKDKQEIIFEKLRRLIPSYHNKVEGHGIGLYIVDQYVGAMSGKIDVESELEQGSTFAVTLPLKIVVNDEGDVLAPPKLTAKEVPAACVASSFTPAKSMVETPPKDAICVLLVEDSPLIQAVTKEMLQSVGMHVDVANDGQEAIALFAANKYALVYMDIGLPDMDGYEVSQCLRVIEARRNAEQTPILALTAHAAVDVETFCVGAGMQGVLSKPLSCKQARQIVDYYVFKRSSEIDNFSFLEELKVPDAPDQLEIIDFPACVAIVENETRAKEMLAMILKLLDSTFVPEIAAAYDNQDLIELRKALHKFLGSLSYVSAPALKQATLDIQTVVKEKQNSAEQFYRSFLHEVQRFKEACIALVQV